MLTETETAPRIIDADRLIDDDWDGFLQSTPLGQYQQSSRWGAYKHGSGWQPVRRLLGRDDRLLGGYQMLLRRSRLGNIAYISKGPIVADENEAHADLLLQSIRNEVRHRRVRALLLQPPDEGAAWIPVLKRWGYQRDVSKRVINTNLVIDLTLSKEVLWRRMSRTRRREIRLATKTPLEIIDGNDSDLPMFFQLMEATCQRLKTSPNPASLSELRQLWGIMEPVQRIRVFLAKIHGRIVAGLLLLLFGRSATAWKKGWNGESAGQCPNQFLGFHAIQWAKEMGYISFDWVGLDRCIAEHLLNGHRNIPESRANYSTFNLGFGGHPRLLPPAMIWIPNPMLRSFYRVFAKCRRA